MRYRSGFTFLEMIVTLSIIMVLAGLLFPAFARSREAARRTQCQSNLRQIGTALHLYAQDNNGRLPPTEVPREWIAALMPRVKNTQVFVCPSEPRDSREKYGVGVPSTFTLEDPSSAVGAPAQTVSTVEGASYQYRAGMANDDPATVPLARDWSPWHLDGVNVMFLDGRVQWFAAVDVPLAPTERPEP